VKVQLYRGQRGLDRRVVAAVALGLVLAVTGCSNRATAPASNPGPGSGTASGGPRPAALEGTVLVDGSSTVYPIAEAVAEEFGKLHAGVRVMVGVSGTGGGFKRFTAGETDVQNASRPIKNSERRLADQNGIRYLEFPVAFDGLAVVVNPANDFVDCMTAEELRRLWEPGSAVTRWSQLRPGWPDREIKLYGPGPDSGTFDYFTEAIVGRAQASRPDFVASEDDNVLVQGIAGDRDALGYFGYAYYVENTDKLKLVAVDGGQGCVYPSLETINNGTYSPLSRPLHVYVNAERLKRPEVEAFVRFYLEHAATLAAEVGYIPLPDRTYRENLARFEAATR